MIGDAHLIRLELPTGLLDALLPYVDAHPALRLLSRQPAETPGEEAITVEPSTVAACFDFGQETARHLFSDSGEGVGPVVAMAKRFIPKQPTT